METKASGAMAPVTLDEIVFEHRNKDYGAYELRTNYTSTVNRAMWIGITLFVGLFLTSYIFAQQKDDETVKGVVIDLENVLIEPEEPLIEKIPEPEPVKPIEQVKTIQYVAPKVVENTMEEIPMPDMQEIETSIISTKTQEGRDAESIAEAPPAEPVTEVVKATEIEEDNTAFIHVEMNPSFVGGTAEMYKFLSKNLKYPAQAQRQNIQGKVFLSFIVEKDGSITDVQVAKGIGFGCDEEASKAVKLMPKWIAGKQNGRNVRVRFTIPVIFKLED